MAAGYVNRTADLLLDCTGENDRSPRLCFRCVEESLQDSGSTYRTWVFLGLTGLASVASAILAALSLFFGSTARLGTAVRTMPWDRNHSPAVVLRLQHEATCIKRLQLEPCKHVYPEPYPHGSWPTTYSYGGSFPPGFMWGLSSAAYQVEGAFREDGRGASIWDTFTGANTVGMKGASCSYCCKKAPCPVAGAMAELGATGNVASDHYHLFEVDVALMKSMGLRHYSFSISWPRILPTGKLSDGINNLGRDFYNKLIDSLLEANITPHVTLYHWDLPQGLFDPPAKLAWWAHVNRSGIHAPWNEVMPDFLAYADLCFSEFGHKVKWWRTFADPWVFTSRAAGLHQAPQWMMDDGFKRDAPYIAAHNVLNAHAAVVDLYRQKYQREHGGMIGITVDAFWREPKSTTLEDVSAAARGVLFQLGLFLDPIFGGRGDFPAPMRTLLKSLPNFSRDEQQLINGSADFLSLSYSGTEWAFFETGETGADNAYSSLSKDRRSRSAAWGARKLLRWLRDHYGRVPLFITDISAPLPETSEGEQLQDPERAQHTADLSAELLVANQTDHIDIRGFFPGPLLDSFEWSQGYNMRRGFVYNDFRFGSDKFAPLPEMRQPTPFQQVRSRKGSSCWLEAVWTANKLLDPQKDALPRCSNSSVFRGEYTDAKQPGCQRSVVVDKYGTTGHVHGKESGGQGEWGPFPALFSGGTVVVDFSSTGGPRSLAGFWDGKANAIVWADGTHWTHVE